MERHGDGEETWRGNTGKHRDGSLASLGLAKQMNRFHVSYYVSWPIVFFKS